MRWLIVVAISAVSLMGSEVRGGGLPNNPDLIYNAASGGVQFDADGANMVSFFVQSAGQFIPPASFADLDADVGIASALVDNTPSQIGWVSALIAANIGFDGPALASLGNVFPTGLDDAGLANLLTGQGWAAAGGGGAEFDLIVGSSADFDKDGDVDGADFLLWQANFGTTSGATPNEGDADGDGAVDGDDFLIWQAGFSGGSGSGGDAAPATQVPEPSATWLMLTGLAACSAVTRRRT